MMFANSLATEGFSATDNIFIMYLRKLVKHVHPSHSSEFRQDATPQHQIHVKKDPGGITKIKCKSEEIH
jgi:hypothetical protein